MKSGALKPGALKLGALFALLPLAFPAIAVGGEVPVPRITVYAGDTITEAMLVDRAAPGTIKPGAFFDGREAVLGKVALRTLFPGQPIPVNALRTPYAVTQGSPVLLVYEARGLSITARGTALQSGAVGQTVSVRNTSSGVTVIGIARPNGAVQVGAE
jgi:flagellar basal body P-ring formation protein FlgA